MAKRRAAEIRAEKDHIDQMQAGMDPSLLVYSKIKAKVRNDETACKAADKDHNGQLDAEEARKGYLSECNRVRESWRLWLLSERCAAGVVSGCKSCR